MPTFEYDPVKSEKNQAKHGIDFVQAQRLWHDPHRLTIPANSEDEPRYAVLARYRRKLWVAFCADHVRIISVRRARTTEEHLYES